jgi:hypothetical protein
MPTPALYDTLRSFQDIHKVVLNLADDLNDEQLNWKPEGYSTPLDFIFGIWRANQIISKLPFCITIRNSFPSLVMEKRSGKKSLLHRNGAFPRDCMKPLGLA